MEYSKKCASAKLSKCHKVCLIVCIESFETFKLHDKLSLKTFSLTSFPDPYFSLSSSSVHRLIILKPFNRFYDRFNIRSAIFIRLMEILLPSAVNIEISVQEPGKKPRRGFSRFKTIQANLINNFNKKYFFMLFNLIVWIWPEQKDLLCFTTRQLSTMHCKIHNFFSRHVCWIGDYGVKGSLARKHSF